MKISGLQKTTLLDYPGHVAATIFLGGCNFRCPFCHNSDLLEGDSPDSFSEEEILSFLKKRASILQGVCITGGEPTLQPDLEDFLQKIRTIGLKIKLDTNGYRPQILKMLAEKKLLDYVAMDIKAGPSGYAKVSGCQNLELSRIRESADFLMTGSLPFEFRTTVVRGLHTTEDFREIAQWIAGDFAYYIQSYKDSEQVLVPGYSAFSVEELRSFADMVRPSVPNTFLRGIE